MGKNALKHLIKGCGLGVLVFVSGCSSETEQTGIYHDGNRVQTVPFPPGMFQETWCQDGTFSFQRMTTGTSVRIEVG